MKRTFMRAGLALATTGALVAVSAGAASAHECYVANRSDQGNASVAAHSAAWEEVSLNTIVTVFLGQTQEVADCVEPLAAEAGIPSSFVFGNKQAVGQGNVIAENNPNMSDGLASDGQGIDHAEDVYGDAIVGLILQCGGTLG